MTLFLLLAVIAGATLAQPPAPLRVNMISIGVTDMDRSIRFYTETLGLPIAGPRGEVTMIRAGEITIALNKPLGRSAGTLSPGAVEIVFSVESVSATEKELKARGCTFTANAHEVTQGLWASTFPDPDGHKLTLLGGR
jgi:predicted enzyme related to lactoylglutathione lyase